MTFNFYQPVVTNTAKLTLTPSADSQTLRLRLDLRLPAKPKPSDSNWCTLQLLALARCKLISLLGPMLQIAQTTPRLD